MNCAVCNMIVGPRYLSTSFRPRSAQASTHTCRDEVAIFDHELVFIDLNVWKTFRQLPFQRPMGSWQSGPASKPVSPRMKAPPQTEQSVVPAACRSISHPDKARASPRRARLAFPAAGKRSPTQVLVAS